MLSDEDDNVYFEMFYNCNFLLDAPGLYISKNVKYKFPSFSYFTQFKCQK